MDEQNLRVPKGWRVVRRGSGFSIERKIFFGFSWPITHSGSLEGAQRFLDEHARDGQSVGRRPSRVGQGSEADTAEDGQLRDEPQPLSPQEGEDNA